MKNYPMFLTALVLMLSILSCSESDPVEEGVRKEVKVTATFKGLSSSVTSRALDNDWEVGDSIGLFMKGANTNLTTDALACNVKFTTTTGSTSFLNPSENKVYFPFNNQKVDFISYHPYRDLLNGLLYELDVVDQSDLSAIDLMYSDNAKGANSTNENVNVEFEHQLSNVIVSINIGDTGKEPTDFSVKITNVNTKASFSLANGLISDAKAVGDVSFNVDVSNTKAQAVLLPDKDLTGSALIVTISGTSYLYDLSKCTPGKSFEKARKYEFNLTLRAGEGPDLDGLTATIKDWIATVPEDAYADEIPISDGDEGGVTEPVEGGPVPDSDAGDKGEDGDPSPEPVVGDGTQENPYSIAQVKQLESGNGIWLEGYLVGGYTTSYFSNDNFTTICSSTSITNVALADSQSETSPANTYPIDFSIGPSSTNFSKKINLKDNSGNMKKKLLLLGDIKEESKWARIINVKQVFLERVEIK